MWRPTLSGHVNSSPHDEKGHVSSVSSSSDTTSPSDKRSSSTAVVGGGGGGGGWAVLTNGRGGGDRLRCSGNLLGGLSAISRRSTASSSTGFMMGVQNMSTLNSLRSQASSDLSRSSVMI